MKFLSISTDRKIFEENSPVRDRQERYARELEELDIIIFADKTFNESSVSKNCFVYPTRSFSKFLYPLDAIKLGKFIIPRRGITNITCQDPFLTAMAGISLKKQFGLPLEIQIHTDIGSPHYSYTTGNKIRKSLALSYLPQADTIRVVSNRVKKYLVESLKIDEARITVRPIEVNTDKIKNTPVSVDLHKKYQQFNKIVLVASRQEPEKNVALALRGFALVCKKFTATGMVVVGNGSEHEYLKGLAQSLGIQDNVIFEPWANSELLYSYYKTADVFLNTSLFEGYGMTLVEAQAAGCKVISTDVGIAPEIGALIVDQNEESVADGIRKTLSV